MKTEHYSFKGMYGFGFAYSNKLIASDGKRVVQLERAYTSTSNQPNKIIEYTENGEAIKECTSDTFGTYITNIIGLYESEKLEAIDSLNRLKYKYDHLMKYYTN